MSETSLKPVIDKLENLFSKFNEKFYNGELQTPIITVSPDTTKGAYGWCTAWKAWSNKQPEQKKTVDLAVMSKEDVRNQVNRYWNDRDQDTILAILKGIFAMASTGTGNIKTANAAFVSAHTYDISAPSTDAVTTDAMKVSATTLNSAIQQACGDNKQKFSLVICHSTVATNLENMKLIAYLKYTDADGVERDLGMATWNGRLVLIDDSMPVEVKNVGSTGGDVSLYTTYILGEGAIGFEPVGAKVPYEMVRDAKTRGGEDTLISRKRNAVSVAGISYLKASQATNSPTNAELENGKNWSLVSNGTDCIAHKAIPIARIISRG